MTRTTTAIPATTQSTSATTSPQPVRLPPGWLLLLLLHDSYASLPSNVGAHGNLAACVCTFAEVACVWRIYCPLTTGAVLVVQLRCTALACALATGRPTAMHQADRPIYVQVHSRSAGGALPGSPRPGTLLQHYLCRPHHVDA
jgi:hypothetical protein